MIFRMSHTSVILMLKSYQQLYNIRDIIYCDTCEAAETTDQLTMSLPAGRWKTWLEQSMSRCHERLHWWLSGTRQTVTEAVERRCRGGKESTFSPVQPPQLNSIAHQTKALKAANVHKKSKRPKLLHLVTLQTFVQAKILKPEVKSEREIDNIP